MYIVWCRCLQELSLDRRVDMLYLVDSLLQASQRQPKPAAGADGAAAEAAPSPAGRLFRDAIAAALPR